MYLGKLMNKSFIFPDLEYGKRSGYRPWEILMRGQVSYGVEELEHEFDEFQRGAQLLMFCQEPKANLCWFLLGATMACD